MREYAIGTDLDLQSSLTPEGVRKLAARGIERKYKRGDCLFHQGDRGTSVALLLQGRVKVCLSNSSGVKTILRIHLPGSLIGMSALGSLPFRDSTATAMEAVTVAELSSVDMQTAMLEDSALALRVMRLLLDRLADLHSRLADLQATSVDHRLARVLLALAQHDPTATISSGIALTHEDLSSMVGARRPTITSALSKFESDGLIEKSGRNIVIKNPKGLSRLLSN